MMAYTLHGQTFQASREERGAFDVFNPDCPDLANFGPEGMVEELRTFLRMTEERDCRTLLDVGALFGLFSLMFTRTAERVAYAVEPSPWAFPILIDHCQANPERHVVPIQALAGALSGHLVPCGRDWRHVVAYGQGGQPAHIPETAIDDMDLGRVDAVKVDVEGYEVAVLRGAERTLTRWHPLLFLECHLNDLARYGESRATLMETIRHLGYTPTRYDGTPVETFEHCSLARVVCLPN